MSVIFVKRIYFGDVLVLKALCSQVLVNNLRDKLEPEFPVIKVKISLVYHFIFD